MRHQYFNMNVEEGERLRRKGAGSPQKLQEMGDNKPREKLASMRFTKLPIRIPKQVDLLDPIGTDKPSEGNAAMKDEVSKDETCAVSDECPDSVKTRNSTRVWDPSFFQSNRSMATIELQQLQSSLGKRSRSGQDENEVPEEGSDRRRGKIARSNDYPPEMRGLESSKVHEV